MTRRSMSSDYPTRHRDDSSDYCSRRLRRRKRRSSSRRDRRRSSSSSRRDRRRSSSSSRRRNIKRRHSSSPRRYGSRTRRRRRNSSSRRRRDSSSGRRRESSYDKYKSKRRRRSSRKRSKDRSDSEQRRVDSKRRHRDRERSAGSGKPVVRNTEEGHLIFSKCDTLHDRYEIKRELGEGTFGKVVLCKDKDRETDDRVAVKIIRNVPKYRDAAQIEIEILEKIRKAGGCEGSVEMFGSFDYHGHMCIVFEVLGRSVFDFLKDNGFTGFPMSHVQRIGSDVNSALMFLHGMKYTHTDLKPENILFIDSDYESVHDKHAGMTVRHVLNPAVKIIDFGSATHEDEHHSRIVSTRHYRAPEVIAEIGWSYPCDMWSVGCILFELYTGHTLFQTHDNREHLGIMQHILGPLPQSICKTSSKRYFKKDRLDFSTSGSSGRYIRKYCKKLEQYQKEECPVHASFFDLLQGLLDYTATDRLTAAESLKHQFFDRRLFDRDGRSYKSR